MGSRHMGYPSPRGVHVPETYASYDSDAYQGDLALPPRRNRYSRSSQQTPRIKDVTWISSSSEPTPQTPHAPPSPWLPPPQVPSSPAYRRTPSLIPPSPVPTVGEHMLLDDAVFVPDDMVDPYRPQRQPGGVGLIKSFWKGLKKLSGFQSNPHLPWTSSYGSQTMEMPVPASSAPSGATQYVDTTPTPPEMDEQHGVTAPTTPYASPYARPTNMGSTPAVIPGSLRGSPVPVPSIVMPGSLRGSPGPVPSIIVPPPITVVSPSIPPSPLPSPARSARRTSPARGVPRHPGVAPPDPFVPPADDGSQTLHEPVFPSPTILPLLSQPSSAPAPPGDGPKFPDGPRVAFDVPSSSNGSLSSTMARLRRFVTGLDGLPWVSDTQIADEYFPDKNPRSRMRAQVRQGAEPSWYNPRPEVEERPEYWSEWDMWAKQSTAGLWEGGGGTGQWGVAYPHGYVPAHPPTAWVYPSGYPPPGVVSEAPVMP